MEFHVHIRLSPAYAGDDVMLAAGLDSRAGTARVRGDDRKTDPASGLPAGTAPRAWGRLSDMPL
jgi:hypothetical protein